MFSSGYEYDAEPMSNDMLENIHVSSQSHPSINRIEVLYNICHRLNKIEHNRKELYYQRETWVKVYTIYVRLLLMKFQKHYQFLVNQA